MLSNINIAIIAMVKEPRIIKPTDCGIAKAIANATSKIVQVTATVDGTTATKAISSTSHFEWDEIQQSLILGAPFWLYSIVQIPAGILARNYSAKRMFGIPHLICALLAFIVPTAAYHSFKAIFALRLIHGLFAGLTSPAVHAIVAKWIPPDERSHFMTTAIASALAIAIVYPFFGWLIEISRWENVFYLTGAATIIWYICWYFLMYDSPTVHPRITKEEREYIQEKLGNTSHEGKLSTPWRAILSSKQVWLNCLVSCSYGFIFMLHTTYSPMYFKAVHGADLKECTLLTGIPHFVRIILALFVGKVADRIIRSGTVSRTNVRKFASCMCTIGAGITFVFLAYIGCNFKMASILFAIIVATSAFPNAGFYASTVDISPNFACIIYSISSTITAIGQILVTIIVGWIIEGDQSNQQWQKIFLITAAVGIIPGLIYITYGSAKVQDWNLPKLNCDDEEVEQQVPLKVITKGEAATASKIDADVVVVVGSNNNTTTTNSTKETQQLNNTEEEEDDNEEEENERERSGRHSPLAA